MGVLLKPDDGAWRSSSPQLFSFCDMQKAYLQRARVPFAKCGVRSAGIALAVLAHDPCVACRRVEEQMVLLLAVTNGHGNHVAQIATILVDRYAVLLAGILRVDNVVCVLLP